MKKSAVDYLFQELWDRPKDKLTWNVLLKYAKDMEKEQIIIARQDGIDIVLKGYAISHEEYYKKTYGKDA